MRVGDLSRGWQKFWFESEPGQPFEWFQRLLGVVLFCFYLTRTPDLELFYSSAGFSPLSVVPDIMQGNEYRFTLLTWFTSIQALWICHFLLLAALAGLIFGIQPRLSAFCGMVMHLSFVHRNMAGAYGVDVIASYYLFYLFLAGGPRPAGPETVFGAFLRKLRSVAFRFCQIQVCLIYGYSGLEKIRGPLWWNGEALWYVLVNTQYARWDLSWLSAFPSVTTVFTFLTVLWEVYFPVLVLGSFTRLPVLLGGVFLHIGIGLTLYIPYFGALMICTYLLFLRNEETAWFSTLVRSRVQGCRVALSKSLKLKAKVAVPDTEEIIV